MQMCCFDHLHSRLTAIINQTNLFFVLQGIKKKKKAANATHTHKLVNKLNDLSIQTNLEKPKSGELSGLAWPYGEGDSLSLHEISLILFSSYTHCMLMQFAQKHSAVEKRGHEPHPGVCLR